MPSAISINSEDVLLAIDLQADFMPGGALAVDRGDEIVPLVNRLASRFEHIVITQDWHPPTHASFAASHEGAKPFDTKRLHYGDQTLWPEHCVQGTPGAALHADLAVDLAFLILRKGMRSALDSYSAFVEADGNTTTGLAALLKARGVKRVFACGLATDFCVAHSALDARSGRLYDLRDRGRVPGMIDANDSLQRRLGAYERSPKSGASSRLRSSGSLELENMHAQDILLQLGRSRSNPRIGRRRACSLTASDCSPAGG